MRLKALRRIGRVRLLLGVALSCVAFLVASCGSKPQPLGGGSASSSGGDGVGSSSGNVFGATGPNGAAGGQFVTGPDGGIINTGGNGMSTVVTGTGPFVQDDTPKSGVPAATITELKMGGSSCTTDVVYPYSLTLFPAEGVPPVIQWNGTADAAYIKMTYGMTNQVLYEAATGASNPGRFAIPQVGWSGVSVRTPKPPAPRAPLQVTLSVKNGNAISTCVLKWYVASGALNGAIYYNSYDDPGAAAKIGFASGNQGSVLRLPFGATAPQVFLYYPGPPMPMSGTGPCITCHSVSARGTSLAATYHDYSFFQKQFEVYAYDIAKNPNPQPPRLYTTGIPAATFGALTPDGKYLLSMGNPDCTAGAETYPRSPNNMPLVEGSVVAKLWNVQTGTAATAAGLNPNYYMWMPQFSPNGDKVVFNHAKPGANGRTDRRELATMDYDAATQTFSNLQLLYTDTGPTPSMPYGGYNTAAGDGTIPAGANGCTQNVQPAPTAVFNDSCTDVCYPGWPFFTPDGNKVIFVRGTEPDFAGMAPGLRNAPSKSQLYIIDVATKVVHELTNANTGATSMNLGYEYFPTVMPVASGGQFWAFFTSRRTYGNNPYAGLGAPDAKKIWVSAIDIGAAPNEDPSHPPFYLSGQGASGNLRAFPVLNPCKADGMGCGSGLDCCGGSCVGEGKTATCGVRPPQMCGQIDEKCTTASDCCDQTAALQCIGGFCALPSPPK